MKQETLEDAPKAEGKLQIDAEADDEKERSEAEADENISRIFGVTWKLDIGESDYPEFHGGISPQDYFEEFDEDGEPPIRPGQAIMRQTRTTTAVPMSIHRFCRRNIHWERRQSFRKSAFS